MNHTEAIQMQAAEKYLLGELSEAQQDAYAEHYFDCEECARDLQVTSLFLDTSKKVMAEDLKGPQPMAAQRQPARWQPAWYAVAASIALLAVVLYQNVFTIPQLRSFAAPQALEYFSIVGLGSRGAQQTVVSPSHEKPFILLVDIPPHENVDQYRCQILDAGGKAVVSIDVSEDLAKKTVPLLVPASKLSRGSYTFAILGRTKQGADFAPLERYPLQVN